MTKRAMLCLSFCMMIIITGCSVAGQKETPAESVSQPPSATDQPISSETPEDLIVDGITIDASDTDSDLPETEYESGWMLDDFPLAFGFADLTGDRLIIQSYEDGTADEGDPARYTMAIGPYGETVRIGYTGWQDETEENNYRDMAYNFDNLSGYVYRATDGKLQPDQTYCLTSKGVLDSALIPLVPPPGRVNDPYGYAPNPDLDDATIDRIIGLKFRGVVWAEELAVTANGAQIGLVLFERLGDDMLFSIVYLEGEKTLFWDCPAEYDEYSVWRVDMGDQPGMFTPLFLARLEKGLVLMVAWGAPEGENIVFLYEDNVRFIDRVDYQYYRYRVPE